MWNQVPIVALLFAMVTVGQCANVDLFEVTSGIPTKGQQVDLSCKVSGAWNNNVYVYKPGFQVPAECQCASDMCIPGSFHSTCGVSSKTVSITIKMAKRSDEGEWICQITDGTVLHKKILKVLIYTLPTSISYQSLFQQPQSLWENGIDMICKTDQCTYKDPVFTWYYSSADGSMLKYTANRANLSSSTSSCNDSEKIYSSTLTLPQYTKAPRDEDLTTKFQCSLSFLKIAYSTNTSNTPEVSFAVQVLSVTITQGSNVLATGQTVTVDENVTTTFTCTTGTSKPISTIIWFVGSSKQTYRGTSFSYIPHNGDHGSDIYCAAYNIQTVDQAVPSKKPKLYVRVEVSTVRMKKGNTEPGVTLTVTEGVPVTLTCDTGISRPDPKIEWYIDNTRQKGPSTDATYILNAMNADHEKEIYCKAYKLHPETEGVLSAKHKLFVNVQVSNVTLWQGTTQLTHTLEVTAGSPTNLTCQPGFSRPAPTIRWFIGNTVKQSTSTTYSLNARDVDHDKLIYCEAYNQWNPSQPVVSSKPKLYVKVQVSSVTLKQGGSTIGGNLTVTAGTPVSLTCLPGISRPAPTIQWYIGNTLKQSTTSTTYRLLAANDDHDAIIYCKAYNLQSASQAVISTTPKLYVKVQVSTITLLLGNTQPSQALTVIAGSQVTLTCQPGTSRPEPTIMWYIGTSEVQSSTSTTYSLNASNGDHDKMIYCKAYNLQNPSQAVVSSQPKMYVKVQVSSVTLKQGSITIGGNLTVTAGTPVSLTCLPGISRPAPTIQWYIGNTLKQNTTSTTYSLNAVNDDHDAIIYCKAYNLQTANQAVASSTPKLYVRVEATIPTIINGTMDSVVLLETDIVTIQCQSTHTRPASVMSWKLDSTVLSGSTWVEFTTAENLIYVVSSISFTTKREHNGSHLICESHIHGQSPFTESRKTVIVWWRPNAPAIQTVSQDFPWTEGQKGELVCTSTNTGNPESSVTWIDETGSKPNQRYYIIENLSFLDHRRTVKCQMENEFTREKNEQIVSHVLVLKVQFSPKIFTHDIVLAGKPTENMTSQVPFYENPEYQSITVLANDTQLTNETQEATLKKYEIITTAAELNQSVTGAANIFNGSRLDFTVMDLEEADFTTYLIRIANVIGAATINVTLRAESEPLAPTNFILLDQKGSTLFFYWEEKFNGGFSQTFNIEVKKADTETWVTKKTIHESDSTSKLKNGSYIANITDLQPGDYSVRLSSENEVGRSGLAMLNVSINIPSTEQPVQGGPPIGAAVGGGVGGAIVIIAIVVAIIYFQRKMSAGNKKKALLDENKRNDGTGINDDFSEVNNPAYISADIATTSKGNDVYAVVDKSNQRKNISTANSAADVYTQVQKKKNGQSASTSKGNDVYAVVDKSDQRKNISTANSAADVNTQVHKPKKGQSGKVNVPSADMNSMPVKPKGKQTKEKNKKHGKKRNDGKHKDGIQGQVNEGMYENTEQLKSNGAADENAYELTECSSESLKLSRMQNEDGLTYVTVDFPQASNGKSAKPFVIHGIDDSNEYADIAFGKVGEPALESDDEDKAKEENAKKG